MNRGDVGDERWQGSQWDGNEHPLVLGNSGHSSCPSHETIKKNKGNSSALSLERLRHLQGGYAHHAFTLNAVAVLDYSALTFASTRKCLNGDRGS